MTKDEYIANELRLMHGRTPKTAEYLLSTAWDAGFFAGSIAAGEQKKRKRAAPSQPAAEAPSGWVDNLRCAGSRAGCHGCWRRGTFTEGT